MNRHQRDQSFTEFVASRRTRWRATAYFLCGDWHLADDVVQLAAAKLYVAWPKVRSIGTEDAYARRIIARAAIDESRRPWRRERPAEVLPERAVVDGISAESRDSLMRALAELPAGQRKVVVLRYWLGLSVEETAHDLQCAAGTVKSQAAKGLARLRDQLRSEELTNGTGGGVS